MTEKTMTRVVAAPDETRRIAVCAAGGCCFAAATAVAALVRIPLPFSPVPVTLQTMVVLLAGATLGPWAGAGSQLLYLAAGCLGVPVFAAAGAGLLGPTAGYLVAFPVAAGLVGWAARRGSRTALALGLLAATALIYALGTAWLVGVTGKGFGAAALVGIVPFLPGDALKLAGAFALARFSRAAYDNAKALRPLG